MANGLDTSPGERRIRVLHCMRMGERLYRGWEEYSKDPKVVSLS